METSPKYSRDDAEYFREAYEYYRSRMVELLGPGTAAKVEQDWAKRWNEQQACKACLAASPQ